MKKFVFALVALLVAVAMATPVMAEDRLSLSGQFRARAWHSDSGDNQGQLDAMAALDGVDPGYSLPAISGLFNSVDSTKSYADQRFRLGAKIAVADGVSLTLRTDITEANWGGDDSSEFGNGRSGADQQWDRAHMDVTMGDSHLRVGQMFAGFGYGYSVNSQDAGIAYDVKTGAGKLAAFYLIDADNGAEASDATLAGVQFSNKAGGVGYSLFVANQKKDANAGEDVMAFGGTLAFAASDALQIDGGIDFFTGDAAENVDAAGMNVTVNAQFKASDMMTVGGMVFYAPGEDTDVMYDHLGNDFNGWDPINDVGTSLDNEKISYGRPFSMFNFKIDDTNNTGVVATLTPGVVAVRVNGDFKASDKLDLGAAVTFAQPEDDAIVDTDALAFAGSAVYAFAPNTTLQAQLQYLDIDELDDAILSAGAGLFVNF